MNYYAVLFLLPPPPPPDFLRCRPFFERKNVCNSHENGVRTRCAAIVHHYAIVNLRRRVNLLRRSIFHTAGSFGYFFWVAFTKTTGITKTMKTTNRTQTATNKRVECCIQGNCGNHGNMGCKLRSPETTGLETNLEKNRAV